LDEFLEQLRNGNSPNIDDYVARNPSLETDIREVFSALIAVEGVNQSPSASTHLVPGSSISGEELPHSEIGDFKILREIGRGGMGVVYEAIEQSLGRRVALKLLPQAALVDPKQVERFQNEARSAAKLNHAHIVPVYSVGESDGLYFFAMQYIDGAGLDVLIRHLSSENWSRQGELSAPIEAVVGNFRNALFGLNDPGSGESTSSAATRQLESAASNETSRSSTSGNNSGFFHRIAQITLQVADALSYAHKRGVLHRDIKPSNIMLDENGEAWVADFGLAKSPELNLTRTGEIVGTLRYMPPERLRGDGDARSDIYSLGLTLYESCTLHPAFPSVDRGDMIRRIMHESPPPPSALNAKIPADLELVITKAISKNPEDRYQKAEDFADDLLRFTQGRPVHAQRASWLKHTASWCRRNPVVALLMTAIATLMLCLTIVSTFSALKLSDQNEELTRSIENEKISSKKISEQLVEQYCAQARLVAKSNSAGRRNRGLAGLQAAKDTAFEAKVQLDKIAMRQTAVDLMSMFDVGERMRQHLPDYSDLVGYFLIGFDPHQSRCAYVDSASGVTVYDFGKSEIVKKLPGNWYLLTHTYTTYSRNGKFLIVSGQDRDANFRLQVWSTDKWELLLGVATDSDVSPSAFSVSDWDHRLAYVAPGKIATVRSLADNRIVSEVVLEKKPKWLALAPSGGQLLIDQNETLMNYIVDSNTTGAAINLRSEVNTNANDAEWSPRGRFVALAGSNGYVYVWDVSNPQQPKHSMLGHPSDVSSVKYHPHRDIIMSTSRGGSTCYWDSHLGRLLMKSEGMGYDFTNDGEFAAFEETLGKLSVRPIYPPELREVSHGYKLNDDTLTLGFSPDSATLVWGSRNHRFCFHDLQSHYTAGFFEGYQENCNIAFDPNSSEIITSGYANFDRIRFDHSSQLGRFDNRIQERTPLLEAGERTLQFSVSQTGVIAAVDRGVELTILAPNEPPAIYPLENRAGGVAINSAGSQVAVTTQERVDIYNATTGEFQATVELAAEQSLNAVFSPNDSQLVCCGMGVFYVINTATWQVTKTVKLQSRESIGRAAFGLSGDVLAVNDFDKVVLFDTVDYDPIVELKSPYVTRLSGFMADQAGGLAISPDGSWLGVGSRTNEVQIWDLKKIRNQLELIGANW
jgi:serine/threonine protein kinase/WD40 repeat protein